MNEEFYSIGRGSLNINGKFYYGLDYQITDFMRNLDQENQQLKLQYCERTDCSGRIGNSKKVEQLQQENEQLKSKLEQRDNIINKAREKIKLLGKFDGKTCTRGFQMWVADFNQLLEILNIDKGDE